MVYGVKARTISGKGVISAGTVYADDISIGEIEAAAVVCVRAAAKRIDAPEVCPERLVTNDIADLSLGPGPSDRFRILGRKDNVICSGGIKIQIETVEHQLRPHLQAPFLITKRPDAKFGEAVVLLTEGTVPEAQEVCERILPKYHHPRVYLHVDQIPLTETGKPARQQAEQLARP